MYSYNQPFVYANLPPQNVYNPVGYPYGVPSLPGQIPVQQNVPIRASRVEGMEAHDGRGSQRQVVQGPPSGGRPAQPMQFHNIPTLRPNVGEGRNYMEPSRHENLLSSSTSNLDQIHVSRGQAEMLRASTSNMMNHLNSTQGSSSMYFDGKGYQHVPAPEKENLRYKVEELKSKVDIQAEEIVRRNEELIDLQRNHEAFREKFILFREGMRTKTDESDSRIQQMEESLRRTQEEIAQLNTSAQYPADAQAKELRDQIQQRERNIGDLRDDISQLQMQLDLEKSAGSLRLKDELSLKESILRDLQNRAENQTEFLQSQSKRIAELDDLVNKANAENAAKQEQSMQLQDMKLKPLLDANAEQGKTLQMQSETIQKLERDILDEKEKQTESKNLLESMNSQVSRTRIETGARNDEIESKRAEINKMDHEYAAAVESEKSLKNMLQESEKMLQAESQYPLAVQQYQSEIANQRSLTMKTESEKDELRKTENLLQMKLEQLQDQLMRTRQASQHEALTLSSNKERLQNEVNDMRKRLQNQPIAPQSSSQPNEELMQSRQRIENVEHVIRSLRETYNQRIAEAHELHRSLGEASAPSQQFNSSNMDSNLGPRLRLAEERVKDNEGALRELNMKRDFLHSRIQQLSASRGNARVDQSRLISCRDILLNKLIGNWQKQTLGRAFAAWLRSIEAFKMDRILMESDKYMSMDSSIDDLLTDALSKRRARSIVASSVSLGGSSIDDELFQAAATRPVSGGGGSVVSFGGSSMSGSIEWMV
uniref:Uncharacterized protein n=1 Tax=Hanusia phi TaxID=3032 RepID=A0A7S0E1G1_9CRYP|mmetsp:Transcript_14881/g.34229  ORF Transcript_14881/g.34229 Transcript_14881/m.34229 type:complete len:769 (+) Transcript_14881:51-2357(+)